MRAFLLLSMVVILLPAQPAFSDTLPKVAEAYIPGTLTTQRRISDVIPPADIKSITMLIHNSKGSPVSKGFRPDYDSDEMFARLFRENPVLEASGGLSAYEGPLAHYVIVLKDYSTCFVQVLYDSMHRRDISRLLIRGNGFGGSVKLEQQHE